MFVVLSQLFLSIDYYHSDTDALKSSYNKVHIKTKAVFNSELSKPTFSNLMTFMFVCHLMLIYIVYVDNRQPIKKHVLDHFFRGGLFIMSEPDEFHTIYIM